MSTVGPINLSGMTTGRDFTEHICHAFLSSTGRRSDDDGTL